MFYTGVGSRETPLFIQAIMTVIASVLEKKGYILRSGGAIGADSAFEKGTSIKHSFRTKAVILNGQRKSTSYIKEQTKKARLFMYENNVHPLWQNLGENEKSLHSRNVFQILGVNMDTPSKFTICWTPDGALTFNECTRKTGGTGTAIKVSHMNNVPVFNLQRQDHLVRLLKMIKPEISSSKFNQLVNDIPNFDLSLVA